MIYFYVGYRLYLAKSEIENNFGIRKRKEGKDLELKKKLSTFAA